MSSWKEYFAFTTRSWLVTPVPERLNVLVDSVSEYAVTLCWIVAWIVAAFAATSVSAYEKIRSSGGAGTSMQPPAAARWITGPTWNGSFDTESITVARTQNEPAGAASASGRP